MSPARAVRLLRRGRLRFDDFAQAEAAVAEQVRALELEAARLREVLAYTRAEGKPAAPTEEAKSA